MSVRHEACSCSHCRCSHRDSYSDCLACYECARYTWAGTETVADHPPEPRVPVRVPFERTICACAKCVACCRRQPAMLAPGDAEKIAAYLGISMAELRPYLWASPGSITLDRRTGKIKRLGSIVPRYAHGKCVFLTRDNKCRIHPVSPFGCAYFDPHMSQEESDPRMDFVIRWTEDTPEYQQLRESLATAARHRPRLNLPALVAFATAYRISVQEAETFISSMLQEVEKT